MTERIIAHYLSKKPRPLAVFLMCLFAKCVELRALNKTRYALPDLRSTWRGERTPDRDAALAVR